MTRRLLLTLALLCASPALATVSTTSTEVTYNAAASQTAFTFSFHTLATSDIRVYVNSVLQSTGYSVSLNANQKTTPGGTVTFTTGRSLNDVVLIRRYTSATQSSAFTAGSAFPARSVESAFDRTTLIAQDRAGEAMALVGSIDSKVSALNSGSHSVTSASSVLAYGSTTPRSLTARAADIVHFRDFGTAGDWNGSTGTDDTAAIQAALTAGAGKTVVCDDGAYMVSGILNISSGTRLVGNGNCKIVQRAQNTKLLSVYGASGVTIESVELEGYGLGDWGVLKANGNLIANTLVSADATVASCSDAVGIYVYGSTNVRIFGVTLTKFRNSGIRLARSDKFKVFGNIVVGLYPDDVGGTLPPAGSACRTFSGTDPGLYPPTSTGFSSFAIDYAAVSGDPATYPTYSGASITDNHTSKTSFGLFQAPGLANATWAGNTVEDVAQHCGYFYPGPNFTLDHNTCDRPNFNGWKIQAIVDQYAYPLVGMKMTNNTAAHGRLAANGFIVTMTDSTNGGATSDGTKAGGVFRGVTITGNAVNQWTGVGYHVDHVDGLVMTGNSATDVLSYGAQIYDTTGTVSGNTFAGVQRESIFVTSYIGRTLTVSRNLIDGAPPPPAWTGSTVYIAGQYVQNGGNVYGCYQGGTSAAAGGPSGTNNLASTGVAITDGTVVWAYFGTVAAFDPLAYLFATWNYDPVTPVSSQYYLQGTTIENAGNFYAAMTSATTGSTSGARPTCTSGTCTDGGVVWAYLGSNASATPRGTVVFSENEIHAGPTDGVTYSAYCTNSANDFNFVSTKNIFPTTLTTRYDCPLWTAWGGDIGGGSYSGAPYTAPTGAQGTMGRDFISNGATPSVVDSAGRTQRHQVGDRSWNITPTNNQPYLWVCLTGGSPCGSWKAIYAGTLAANATDSVGTTTLVAGSATVNFSKTYTTAPSCVCSDATSAAACKVTATTSAATFTGTGTDTISYHCVVRD